MDGTSCCLQDHEGSLSRLLAEVEVLRAKKTVVMDFLNKRDSRERCGVSALSTLTAMLICCYVWLFP